MFAQIQRYLQQIPSQEARKHLIVWAALWVFETVVGSVQMGSIPWALFIVNSVYFMAYFYAMLIWAFKPYFATHWTNFFRQLLFITACFLAAKILFDYFVIGITVYAGTPNQVILIRDRIEKQTMAYLTWEIWRLSQSLIYVLLYWYGKRLAAEEKQSRKQEQQQRETEKKLYEAQIAYLRSQINPHFLFNALNYFYAQTRHIQPQVAEGVGYLSDIMRYSFKDSLPNGLVPLADELDQIQNFIQIYRLRFEDTLQVFFEQVGSPKATDQIIPLSLLTLVENAFKYGDLHDADSPLIMQAVIQEKALRFQIQNRIKLQQDTSNTGVGLQNLSRRLEAVYGAAYQLNIYQDETDFVCEMVLPLSL
ncbi:MAG: histidine kinase [Spirosomaceae bacterium]|nr:histidine kinase [Spirosomataceae bacterium]